MVHIPAQVVPRFVELPATPGQHAFMLLEDVIRIHLPRLYHGYEILSCHAIRVTRDADIQLPRGRIEDLLASIEDGLRERRMGTAVRLQYEADLPPPVLATLVDELELGPGDLYEGEGFTAFSDLCQLYGALDLPRLDTVKAWALLPDGRSERVRAEGAAPARSQERLYALAAPSGAVALASDPAGEAELPPVAYRDRQGRDKHVRYWAMRPLAGHAGPRQEISAVRWAPLGAGAGLLTYEPDRTLLATVARRA